MDSIDPVIAPIAATIAQCANDLLDLREAANARQHPGKCVSCYYKVMGIAERNRSKAGVGPLKHWLEKNLEIIAEDESSQVLERFPVKLTDDDLESFCKRVMDLVHFDRGYAAKHICLRFEFRDVQAA